MDPSMEFIKKPVNLSRSIVFKLTKAACIGKLKKNFQKNFKD